MYGSKCNVPPGWDSWYGSKDGQMLYHGYTLCEYENSSGASNATAVTYNIDSPTSGQLFCLVKESS
ncbi:MAG: hypothetical protein GY696_22400 [Gammaproteobacteria bacterium]|nr:hypothetical protein [Gammaproteobacteria bacterium]